MEKSYKGLKKSMFLKINEDKFIDNIILVLFYYFIINIFIIHIITTSNKLKN